MLHNSLRYDPVTFSDNVHKRRCGKRIWRYKSSDSEVKVPVRKRRMPVSDDKFEIQFESKAGGNDRGDSEDETSGSVDGGGESPSMSLISTTLLKKLC